MTSLVLCWSVLFGLAGMIPSLGEGRSGWLGVRMFAAFAVLLIGLFIFQIVLAVALVPAAWAVTALAALGWVAHLGRWRRGIRPHATHPIFILPLLVLAAAAFRGDIEYEPLAFDELFNWLGWMRQAVNAGFVNSPTIDNPILGYPPGWPLVLAFPNLLLGGIEESRSLAMFVLMHVGLLGLVHDVVKAGLEDAGWEGRPAELGAWGILLALLAAETTWKLVPTNLLVEEPQTYCLVACVMLCLAAAQERVGLARAGAMIGLTVALGYLIKVSQLAFMGPLLLLWLVPTWTRCFAGGRRHWRLALGGLAALMLPIIVVWGAWTALGSVQGCLSNPLSIATGLINGTGSAERALDLWQRFSAAEIEYVRAYKFPLTVLAGLGLAGALASRRLAMVPLALAAYGVLYFGALYAYHLDCFGAYYFKTLNSIDRFTRVPLRLFHLCGLVLPLLMLAPHLSRLSARRWAVVAMAGFVMVSGLWQLRQAYASLLGVATRWDATPEQVETVRSIRRGSLALVELVKRQPDLGRQVVQIVQMGQGYEYVIAHYFGIGRFKLAPKWSWNPEPVNVWMTKASRQEVEATLLSASVIWPIRIDGWIGPILEGLIADPECRARFQHQFLSPYPAGRSLRCIGKVD